MSDRCGTRPIARRAAVGVLAVCVVVGVHPLPAALAAPPPPSISIDDVTVTEGNSGTTNAVFTVSIYRPAKNNSYTVDYATADGTATAGADYTTRSGTVTLSRSSPTATVPVPVIGDTIDEPNETFTVNLSNASGGATIADATGVGTITDDDPVPSLAIDDVSLPEGNAGTTTATFTVSLSAVSEKTVSVNWATANGTATAPSDYTTASGTVTFSPGITVRPVDVTVNGDVGEEADETFFVNLSGASNASIADGQGMGTIVNDDTPPDMSIDDVSVAEGNSGTTLATFTVSLSAASGRTVTVDYRAADGTATKPSDYLGTNGTLSFAPGQLAKAVDVTVNGDTLNEDDETFVVNLTNVANATLADAQGLGTITNDDPLPSLSIADATPVTETHTGNPTTTFTVTLSAASGRTVTVDYATSDGTAVAPGDYTAKSGTLTFLAGQTSKTVQVTVIGDTLDEPDETFTVDLSGETNATVADASGLGTILDDDPTPSLSINDVSLAEGDSGKTATFTVTLSAASGRVVTVDYATADGTAVAPDDYTAASGTLTFTSGETSKQIQITIIGETVDETDETFTVDLSNAVNATMADAQGLGRIVNDDGEAFASVADASILEGNSGTKTLTLTVSLTAPRGVPVTIDYATSDATAADGADYTGTSGALTFTPGDTEMTVDVDIFGDTQLELDETFLVDLSNGVEATIADGQAVMTILDDEVALTVKVRKRRTTAVVKGVLTPEHAGKKVVVTLQKKQGGYKRVARKNATLKSPVDVGGDGILDSKYSTKFRNLSKGRYRVVVKWPGDAGHPAKTITKRFRL